MFNQAMNDIELAFSNIEGMTYEKKVSYTKTLVRTLLKILDEKGYGNFFVSSETVLSWYFTIFSSVDRKIKYNEHQFYNEVLDKNVTYDWFYNECLENDHPEMISVLKQFMLKLSRDDVAYFQLLAILIFSLKGNLTYDEKMYLIEFFN